MSNTEKKQGEQKGTANRFKRAAEKEKKTAGGLPEELTAGANAPVEENTAAAAVPAAPEQAPPVQTENTQEQASNEPVGSLAQTYEATLPMKPEPRTVRLQAVITPTLNNKLNDLVKGNIPGRTIQSKNDLINFLLERYFDEIKV